MSELNGKITPTEDSVLQQAFHDCLKEMYFKAQPSVSYDELLYKARKGDIHKDEKVFEHYYLSANEYTYILNKYLTAYRLKETWKDNVDTVIDYLVKGGFKTTYNKDENGIPQRKTEKTPKLEDVIGKENADKVVDLIKTCKNFYRFNYDEMQFRMAMALGPSPTCNKETVVKYWKEKGKEINIIDKDDYSDDDFWNMDYYGVSTKEELEKVEKDEI